MFPTSSTNPICRKRSQIFVRHRTRRYMKIPDGNSSRSPHPQTQQAKLAGAEPPAWEGGLVPSSETEAVRISKQPHLRGRRAGRSGRGYVGGDEGHASSNPTHETLT